MTTKKPMKKPAPGAKPPSHEAARAERAPVRDDFSAIVDLIADAKERGVFDPKKRRRIVAKPTVTNIHGALFARIAAGAKTEERIGHPDHLPSGRIITGPHPRGDRSPPFRTLRRGRAARAG